MNAQKKGTRTPPAEGRNQRAGAVSRRRFLKGVAGAVAAAPLAGCASASRPRPAPAVVAAVGQSGPPRNLIIIVADTFRADHIGAYGSRRVKTPCLDRLAAESVLFTQAYADGLPTIPARRVYHAGRSIIPMRVHGGWIPLKEGRVTLAQVLQRHGFRTGFIADTYHYFKPGMNFHKGFDAWRWIRGQETDRYRSGPREAFDPKKHMPAHLWNPRYDQNMRQYMMNTQDRRSEEDYFCARSLRAGLDWLKENRSAKRFMLFIDTFDPHEPWDAPKRFQEMYYDKYPCERFLFGYGVRHEDIRPEDLPAIRGLYAAEVSFVDMWIGRFVEGVRKLGLLDDTLLVFTTDHGTHLGEEGCVQKTPALLNSCVAHLPLIVRHPDPAFAGKRVDALVSATDYMATWLAMLGVKHNLPLDGKNLWDLVTGRADRLHDRVFTEFGGYIAVRDGRWHYFQTTAGKGALEPAYLERQAEAVRKRVRGAPHLYDLARDPGETKNVVLDHLDVAAEMQEHIARRVRT